MSLRLFPKDLFLKKKIKLYNNIAKVNSCEGRLLVELEVYPYPRITWEFEVLGDTEHNSSDNIFKPETTNEIHSFSGYGFSIKKPYWHTIPFDDTGGCLIEGNAAQVFYSDIEDTAHKFTFYLPNTRFQFINKRQYSIRKKIKTSLQSSLNHRDNIDVDDFLALRDGKFISTAIDDTWSIGLQIWNESLDWLDPKARNTGTLITATGELFQHTQTEKSFPELQQISLSDALERLKKFSWFLAYANGGYLGPLYITGHEYNNNINLPQFTQKCTTVLSYPTTALEQLGTTWITKDSNLEAYVRCFSNFEKMMETTWKDAFHFVLAQYFQAVQPDRVAWQIVASATGTALERLSYAILIEDENDESEKSKHKLLFEVRTSKEYKNIWNCGDKYERESGKNYYPKTVIRISCLLERVGLRDDAKELEAIQTFVSVRNDAVHPIARGFRSEVLSSAINKAIQWIDEILLWRFEYNGEYLDRSKNPGHSIKPRYDLSLRNPDW
jgi:hypothetical protein